MRDQNFEEMHTSASVQITVAELLLKFRDNSTNTE